MDIPIVKKKKKKKKAVEANQEDKTPLSLIQESVKEALNPV